MIHPHTELRFISREMGYGVVATEFIPMGTITWVLDKLDREFSPYQIQQMDPVYQELLSTYSYRNNKGNFILCWDIGRYVNHSFHANCLTTAYDYEIAIRDIYPGDQLTDDYGYLNITEPFRAMPENSKRKVVYPDDLLKYYQGWDRKLEKAFRRLPFVEQPLKKILTDETWAKSMKIGNGMEKMDSILNCYFDPERLDLAEASGEEGMSDRS